jgi:hypothetical protein
VGVPGHLLLVMSKRVGPVGRPGAWHGKSPTRTQPGTVANGLMPAQHGSRAVLGPHVWHDVPGPSTTRGSRQPVHGPSRREKNILL